MQEVSKRSAYGSANASKVNITAATVDLKLTVRACFFT
jgi:hypothetical protein